MISTGISCIYNKINKTLDQQSYFIIQPINIGHGITLGNLFRRILLSEMIGYGITKLKINNINSEFQKIFYIREDILEIILNLKEIKFKSTISNLNFTKNTIIKGNLLQKGPIIITAGMFKLTSKNIKILNPYQYICTLITNKYLNINLEINCGYGYKIAYTNLTSLYNYIDLDTIYTPVKKIMYNVRICYDNYGNIKESLFLDILTNGTITPTRCLFESFLYLVNTFYSLFEKQITI
uniref:RNA polymerase subunit alpha n=1 Tax=Spumella sp. NIES-1846 TaxID=2490549 RepID=A0A455RI00_9STRA|nr:RNA polymerase subunit alpha [Spumella sp. NIES-1846]